jgi:hypothetical protein
VEQLTVLEDVMREYFLPAVPTRFAEKLTLYGDMEKSAKGIEGGKSVVIPMHIALNERGVGNRAENETLPVSGANEYDQAMAYIKYIYGVMSLTGQALKMTKGRNTLIDELKKCMNGMVTALEWDIERQIWGAGDGWICAVASSPAIAGNVFYWTGDNGGEFFKRGMYIDAYPAAGGSKTVDSAKILDVNYATKAVTLDGIQSLAATNKVCREDCVTWNGSAFVSRDMTGLGNIVSSTTTFETLAPATNAYWAAQEHGNSNTPRTLTDLLLMKFIDDIVIQSDKIPTAIYCSLGGRRAYKKMMDDINVPTESMPTKSGFQKGYKYVYDGNEIPIIGSRFGWAKNFVAVNTDHMWFAEAAKFDWENLGGGILKPRETTDSLYARTSWFANIVVDHRAAFGRLYDITEL